MKRMKILSVVAIMMALIFTGTVSMPVLASDTGGDQNAVSEEVQVVEEDDNDSEVLSSKAMAAALVVDDTVSDDGCYLFKSVKEDNEICIEKIADKDEYEKVSVVYMEL